MKLDHQEKFESLNVLTYTTQAYGIDARRYYDPQQPRVSLQAFDEVAQSMFKRKNVKLFTHSPNGIQIAPYLYLTKDGAKIFPVIFDCKINPFTTHRLPNTVLNPLISKMAECFARYRLFDHPIENYKQFEHLADLCFSDFKVQANTRDFQRLLQQWNAKLDASSRRYDRFLDFIDSQTEKFEVHSVIVQRKTIGGRSPQFDEPGFIDMPEKEIVKELAKPLIELGWRKRKSNNVLGILSKWETDIFGVCSMRLIFFVKKEYSDWVDFRTSQLYQELHPFMMEDRVQKVAWGDIATMNAGLSPLFQGQETNYYDSNQLYTGTRLKTLKAHLVGTDYWLRIGGMDTSLQVERGRTEFYRSNY